MKLTSIDEFNYNLPEELIAQYPLDKRDASNLLHLDREHQNISTYKFSNIVELLNENDVLVLNNTKVIKSRVTCHRKTGALIEVFFLKQLSDTIWEVMIKKSNRLTIEESLIVDNNNTIKLIKKQNKTAIIELLSPLSSLEFLEKYGEIPLPPYIKTKTPNKFEQSYQTTFASIPGAVAAPTASLHFTDTIFTQLKQKNIDIIYITLHVGLGTFNPIQTKNIHEHTMHNEHYEINQSAMQKLNKAKKEKKRIVAVGTTVTRALESNYSNQAFHAGKFNTSLYITPGYKFNASNAMLTNFHLPKSSLLILICAFAGKKITLKAYDTAIQNQFRFFSFGDAMLIT